MREKSRARRRVRTRVALFLSLASLAGLYLIRLLGAALHAAGLSAVALSTAGTLLCFLLPALAGLFLLDGAQRGLIALRALSAQHVLCLAAAGALFVGPAALLAELPGAALRLCGAETAQATIRVWMRFRSELNASSRLEVLSGPYKGQVLNIIGPPVANATATRLEILCKTGAEK